MGWDRAGGGPDDIVADHALADAGRPGKSGAQSAPGSAQKLWEAASKQAVAERNAANQENEVKYRGMTKNFSKEWLDSSKD